MTKETKGKAKAKFTSPTKDLEPVSISDFEDDDDDDDDGKVSMSSFPSFAEYQFSGALAALRLQEQRDAQIQGTTPDSNSAIVPARQMNENKEDENIFVSALGLQPGEDPSMFLPLDDWVPTPLTAHAPLPDDKMENKEPKLPSTPRPRHKEQPAPHTPRHEDSATSLRYEPATPDRSAQTTYVPRVPFPNIRHASHRKKRIYNVYIGFRVGSYDDWDVAKKMADGCPHAHHRSFKTLQEAEQHWWEELRAGRIDISAPLDDTFYEHTPARSTHPDAGPPPSLPRGRPTWASIPPTAAEPRAHTTSRVPPKATPSRPSSTSRTCSTPAAHKSTSPRPASHGPISAPTLLTTPHSKRAPERMPGTKPLDKRFGGGQQIPPSGPVQPGFALKADATSRSPASSIAPSSTSSLSATSMASSSSSYSTFIASSSTLIPEYDPTQEYIVVWVGQRPGIYPDYESAIKVGGGIVDLNCQQMKPVAGGKFYARQAYIEMLQSGAVYGIKRLS